MWERSFIKGRRVGRKKFGRGVQETEGGRRTHLKPLIVATDGDTQSVTFAKVGIV